MTQPIYPCLWFDGKALKAAEFYCRIFPNSHIVSHTPLVVHWELDGRLFMGLNGGPRHKFSEAVSLVITCKDQQEIDYYWEQLMADGGHADMCGWLKDQFGLSWQVVPEVLSRLMTGDATRSQRVMEALLQMQKLVIAELEAAYSG